MSKAKEWWINEVAVGRSMNGRHKIYTAVDVLPQNPGWFHVIEYSAYAEVLAKLEAAEKKLDKERAINAVLSEALVETSAKIAKPISMTDAIIQLSEIETRCDNALTKAKGMRDGE